VNAAVSRSALLLPKSYSGTGGLWWKINCRFWKGEENLSTVLGGGEESFSRRNRETAKGSIGFPGGEQKMI